MYHLGRTRKKSVLLSLIPENSIHKWYSYHIFTFMELINCTNDNKSAQSQTRMKSVQCWDFMIEWKAVEKKHSLTRTYIKYFMKEASEEEA